MGTKGEPRKAQAKQSLKANFELLLLGLGLTAQVMGWLPLRLGLVIENIIYKPTDFLLMKISCT